MLERQGTLKISNEFEFGNGVCHIVSYTHHTWAFEALGLNTLTFRLPVSVSVKNIYAPYAALERLGTLKFGNGGVSNQGGTRPIFWDETETEKLGLSKITTRPRPRNSGC